MKITLHLQILLSLCRWGVLSYGLSGGTFNLCRPLSLFEPHGRDTSPCPSRSVATSRVIHRKEENISTCSSYTENLQALLFLVASAKRQVSDNDLSQPKKNFLRNRLPLSKKEKKKKTTLTT